MNTLFECSIEVPFHGVKKNNKQIALNKATKTRFIRSSDKCVFCENWMIKKLCVEKLKQKVNKIDTYINIEFLFYFPKSKFYKKGGDRSKKIPDISNLYELPQDVLQKVGIIENDHLIESHNGSRRLPWDKQSYNLVIKITEI